MRVDDLGVCDERRDRRSAGGLGTAVLRGQVCRRGLPGLLGIHALREAIWSTLQHDEAAPTGKPARRLTPPAAFRQGLISDLGNPKIAVFFASLLPQFVPAGSATFSALLFLGVVFAVITFVWLTLYALVIAKA